MKTLFVLTVILAALSGQNAFAQSADSVITNDPNVNVVPSVVQTAHPNKLACKNTANAETLGPGRKTVDRRHSNKGSTLVTY